MKGIIPSDSRYIPITQQRWCCVPTCILMIMYKHEIPLVPQEELGHYLGLLVPKDQLFLFHNAETGPEPPGGYGTRIFKKEFYPDEAFKKLKIPLKMIYHPIDEFKTEKKLEKYLATVEKENKDVVACFDYGTLHNHSYCGGHATLIDRVYLEKGEARLIDPWFEMPKWQIHKVSKLFAAMKKHGPKKMGGLWEFVKETN